MKSNPQKITATSLETMQHALHLTLTLCLCLLLSSTTFAQEGNPADIPEMKRAPVQGGELEYEIRGEGEPVLLIHGSLIAGTFLPIMEEPSLANYRLIRYHRRGYAGSTAPADKSTKQEAADAVALLRHLGIDRAHIVGHSSGGDIAMRLALDAPEVVHSLVLLEPNDIGPLPEEAKSIEAEFIKEVVSPVNARLREGDTVGAVDIFMRGVAGEKWRTNISRAVPGGPEQAEKDAATYFGSPSSDGPRYFSKEQVGEISQPILFIWGSETFSLAKVYKDLFLTWLPNVEEHQVDGVGHSLQMEDPQVVAEAIADFLKRHPM